MYGVRYYAPDFRTEVDASIQTLLQELVALQHIPQQVVQLRQVPSAIPGYIGTDTEHERELYRRDFVPRASLLMARTGFKVQRALRSRSGGYFLAGTVAIYSRSGVEWHARGCERFNSFDELDSLGFLKALLGRGPELFNDLCKPVLRRKPEEEIIDAFLSANLLPGIVRREVSIGRNRFQTNAGTFDWRKAVDLVIEDGTLHWLIEAKRKLNYTAFGQIKTYSRLYAAANPRVMIRMAIVCSGIERELLQVCQEEEITVFVVTAEGVEVLAPEPFKEAE